MPEKPVITMSTLGQHGRFGNQLFQYAFLKIYAQKYNLQVETPDWIGRYLFGCDDPLLARQLPMLLEPPQGIAAEHLLNTETPYENIDFFGNFIYHTKHYSKYKEYLRSLFQPVAEVKSQILSGLSELRSRGNTIVGLHLRRGDFSKSQGSFFVAPNVWYQEWLQTIWPTLDKPMLFIASDELDNVISDFAEYQPITTGQLEIELPEATFYPDFYLLSQCDIVAISNSSFSFAACLLNLRSREFLRPNPATQSLVPFDPWDSEPVLDSNRIFYIILFPDWAKPEDSLAVELAEILGTTLAHPDKQRINLLVHTTSHNAEYANAILASITMSLVLEEGLDLEDGPEISFMGGLNPLQWQFILPRIHACLNLEHEDKQAIANAMAGSLPTLTLSEFNTKRII
ncbi:alpha-1,2-fucosyltransferase [Trichocoleus sp. FACHB-262]|uniref:alpha-1,2-fucosyltransferase n=1 Tax=Trichocoleus sp. FACHB-262 TaxID=2692869 RepID=UPI0016865336|nr:alpha-1,2-fucosyltransferase [Trichocoleus sp. FACHB-262]MBD2124671.1 alpha-1,2-fucosyltransferase [Trichocoleus sp. FACHB-262]